MASTGADMLIHHGIPWLGQKAVEMGQYYGSGALRNPKIQKKAIDYALDKLNPMIQNVGSQALDQLSTKIRPKKKYKTDRKDLDGGGILDTITGSVKAGQKFAEIVAPATKPEFKRYWSGDLAKGAFNTKDGFFSKDIWAPGNWWTWRKDGVRYKTFLKKPFTTIDENGNTYTQTQIKRITGRGFDIHKAIGKLPKPKSGWTLPGHTYTGPYNSLEKQVKYDPNTGEILEIYEEPTGKTDAVSMQHDIGYSVFGNKPKSDQVKCKNEADRKMVKALDSIPWKERQWGHTVARNAIAAKAKLGLSVKQRKPKNGRSRRVKKTGKKN